MASQTVIDAGLVVADAMRDLPRLLEEIARRVSNANGGAAFSERDLSTARTLADHATSPLRPQHASDVTFRDLLNAAPDAMVVVDEHTKITLLNGRAEVLFGYSRAELVGTLLERLIPDGAGSIGVAHELVGRRKTGAQFPIEVSSSPLVTEGGLLVSHAIRDITDRKHSDRQRAHLAALVDASADAIIGKSLEGMVMSWNRGAQLMFGYAADEMVDRSMLLLIPSRRQAEESMILRALGRGETMRFDTVRRRRDGRELDVSITASPILDHRGEVVGISKVARDITGRKKAEVALELAKEAAESASVELEAFNYSVAHDLRAPLRGMSGFAQLLVETYADRFDADGKDWLAEILLNAKRMAELIDALLSLSRVTRADLTRERVNLSALARSLVVELAAAEPERRVELVIHEEVWVEMDPRLARSLVDNLVRNAWKFTSQCAAGTIEVGTEENAAQRVFYIRDNGAGFDMAFAGKLFAPFQRLHDRTQYAGTGIGLATVQRIVHRHGGRIWAVGHVDAGATFFVSLPEPTAPVLA